MVDFDLVIGGIPRFAAEARWAARLVDRYARLLPFRTLTDTRGRRPTVGDARGDAPIVLVEADPEAYLVPLAAGRLIEAVEAPGRSLVLPVTNEPWTEEARCAPAFAYHTPSLLEEAARHLAARPSVARLSSSPRSPVYAVRREALRRLSGELALDEVPEAAHRGGEGGFIDWRLAGHVAGAGEVGARIDEDPLASAMGCFRDFVQGKLARKPPQRLAPDGVDGGPRRGRRARDGRLRREMARGFLQKRGCVIGERGRRARFLGPGLVRHGQDEASSGSFDSLDQPPGGERNKIRLRVRLDQNDRRVSTGVPYGRAAPPRVRQRPKRQEAGVTVHEPRRPPRFRREARNAA